MNNFLLLNTESVNMCEQVKPHFVELLQHAWQ